MMTGFHRAQFVALLFRKMGCHFLVCVDEECADTAASVASDLFQFGGSLVDDRRYLGNLLRCQVELHTETFAHPPADYFAVR